jgi:M6 family metalloprotease-like protein
MELGNLGHKNHSLAKKLRLLVNLALVLALVLATFTSATAAPKTQQAEPAAPDPYDQWSDEFLDFIPPNPDPIEMAQPDGASFTALLTPAETGGQLETLDGYTILQDAQGWWTFAQPDENGQAIPSDLVVGRDIPQGLAKKIGQTKSRWLDEQGNDKRDAVFEAVKEVQSPNASIFTADDVVTKHYHYIMVLAEFNDVKFEDYQIPQYFEDQISGLGGSATGTVTDLYYEMSYGQFEPEFDVIGPLTLPHDMSWYDYQLPGQNSHSVVGMINDLGPQLQALGVDWDQYDNDKVVYGSGTKYRSVDMVVVLHAGPGKEATGQNGQVWSHASNSSFITGISPVDGLQVRIRAVNTVPAIGFNIGVVSHEMGHNIGEPDYYDTSYRSMGTGDWDLMAGGSWMGNDPAGSNPAVLNPFSRINQGWVTPQEVTDTTLGVQLQPRTVAPDVVMIPLGGSGTGSTNSLERLYIEYVSNRYPGTIFDKAEYNSGLLIWHYDAGGNQTKPTSSPARYRMGLLEYDFRDGTQELPLNLNRGEPTDPWSDTALGMTPYTTPSTDRNTLSSDMTRKTGWYLMNISPIGPSMSLDIVKEADVQGEVGVDRPVLEDQPVIAGGGPATLSAKVYNLTASELSNVKVEFWATMGSQEVLLADTTLASLPAGAPTVATASWDTPLVGKFSIEARAMTADHTATSDPGIGRVFARPASVLIVDDDDGYTAEQAFEGALTSLGVPYVLVEHTAPLAMLQQYEFVIWEAGQAGRGEGQLSKQEVTDLRAYLDAGGKVWFSSPRLACALGTSGTTPPPVDAAFLRDYLGATYPMSNQAGGGTITGMGQYIGGNATFELRNFPGRSIEDFIDPATSSIGSATPLFTWSYGHNLGMEVLGDEAHNNFHVVFFGFNLSQVISGADRLTLTQQVLDQMGIASVYFDNATYLMQSSGAVKISVHDADAATVQATVSSAAQPAGVVVILSPTDIPGNFTGVLNIQKTGSKGGGLKVNSTDTLKVVYQDAPDHEVWATAAVLLKTDKDMPATIYHDLIDNAYDARDLPVMAVTTDDIRVQQVRLFYRVAGASDFISVPMDQTANHAYTVLIPGTAVTPLGLEYYLQAKDSKGNLTSVGSAANPIFIVVQPRTLGMN